MCKIALNSLSIRSILLSIMFFLIIFNPPFLPQFSFTIIFTMIAIIYCMIRYAETIRMIKGTYTRKWIRQFVFFYLYYFLISLFSYFTYSFYDNPLVYFVGSIVDIVSLFFISVFLCLVVFRRKEGFDSLIKYIINAGVIESFFGIFAFISPEIKNFLNGITIANSRSDKIVHAVGTATFRNYGIASTLFDSFGFGMSIMALLALYKALEGEKKYFASFVMIAFAASINARTSMVLIAVGAGIIILGKKAKTFKAAIGKFSVVLFAFIAVCIISNYLNQGGENAQWLSTGIDEIRSLIVGKQTTGTFAVLFREIYFPEDTIQIIFGVGLTPAQAISKTVDMGYDQNLWMFGIIGSLMLYYFYLKPIKIWYKTLKTEKILAVAICIVLFAFLIKINLFGYGISSVVIITIFMGRLITLDMLNNEESIVNNPIILKAIV